MGENKTKTDEEILFPEVTIGDLVIKPWTFGKLFEISALLEEVLDKMDAKSIKLEDIAPEGFMSYTTVARLFTIASPEVLKIVALTTEKTEEEIKELSMQDGIKAVVTIYNQNKEIIKNALGLPGQT